MEISVQQFLDDWFYRVMHSSLAKDWSREQVLASALSILKLNGANLDDGEIEALATMEENELLDYVVPKIPHQMRDNFERISMQTRMLATIATTIRKATDDKNDGLNEEEEEAIQRVFEEHDGSAIGHAILKEAVIISAKEISEARRVQATWKGPTEEMLAKKIRDCEEAEHIQQQLLATEAQLENFGVTQKKKGKGMLLGMAEGQTKALMHTCFSNWEGFTIALKEDRRIRYMYEQQLTEAEKALIAFKEKQIAHIKSILLKDAREKGDNLMAEVMRLWRQTKDSNKLDSESKAKLDALNAKLHDFKTTQAENTKKVMSRMNGNQDEMLTINAFAAWKQFIEDYNKNREFEDRVKKTEQQLKEHMEKKKDDAKQVLARMQGATDSGLLTMCMQTWVTSFVEGKKQKELEKQMLETDCRLKGFMDSHSQNAHGVSARTIDQIEENLTLRVWNAWMTEAKVSHVAKKFDTKIEDKRKQLQKVQILFKKFAQEIEEGLGNLDGDDTYRSRGTRSRAGQGMTKGSEGTVSLPDIHKGGYPA
jgi:hypothetical protein